MNHSIPNQRPGAACRVWTRRPAGPRPCRPQHSRLRSHRGLLHASHLSNRMLRSARLRSGSAESRASADSRRSDLHFIHARLVGINIRTRMRITPCTRATRLLEALGNAADNAGLATRLLARPRAGASSSFENFSIAAGQEPSSSLERQCGASLSGAHRTFRHVLLDAASRFPGSNRRHERFLLLPGAREDTPWQTNSNLCHLSQLPPTSAKPS